MKATSVVLLVIFNEVCPVIIIKSPGGKSTYIDRLDGLCRGRNVPIVFTYERPKTDENNILLNGTIAVREDILTEPELSIRVQKCQNKENPDTCEQYLQYHNKDTFCQLLESNTEFWSPFFAAYTPKFKCPFKAGQYKSINSTLDVSEFLSLPLDVWFWKILAELHEKGSKKLLMCIVLESHAVFKVVHN